MSLALLTLCWVSVASYQQLLEPLIPHYFYAADAPLIFLSSSEALWSVSYTSSYSLTAWVFFHALPSGSLQFFLLETSPGRQAIQALQNSNGSVTIKVETCSLQNLELTGLPTLVWIHIGVSLGSYSQALASAVAWAKTQSTSVWAMPSSFQVYDPTSSRIVLGGSRSVADNSAMVDARFYDAALSQADMLTVAGTSSCPSECFGLCSATFEACYYFPLMKRNTEKRLNSEVIEFAFNYKRTDSSYSSTGWYWFEEINSSSFRCLFQLTQTTSTRWGDVGDRLMYIELDKGSNSITIDFDSKDQGTNLQLQWLPLPVSNT